jgi:membrane-associated phospholipid phosphatase
MLAAHYLGDIFVGTLFGIAVGLLTAGLARGVVRTWLEPSTA